jgi:uncharacterized membrane protein YuzA (DUF378 family)
MALASEVFSGGHRGFAVIGLVLGAAAVLSFSRYLDGSPILRELMNLPLVMSIMLLFGLLNYTEHHPRSGVTGFPIRLFTLPVSTFLLVTCPIVCGVLTVVALYGAWVLLVLRPMGRVFPLAWPALVLGCGMVCYLSVLWSLAAHRLARLVVLSALGTGLVGVSLLPSIYGESMSESRIAVVFVGITSAAYLAALAAVGRQRHAGGVRSSAGQLLQRMVDIVPARRTPFRSPAHALFWLEFRRGGLLLPMGVLLVMLFVLLLALFAHPMSREVTAITFLWVAPLPLILAAFVGKAFSSDLALPAFIAVRPARAGDLLVAKMRAAALSTVVSWVMVGVLAPLWLMSCDRSLLAEWWQAARQVFSEGSTAIIALLLLSAVLVTWKLLIASTPAGLWGRRGVYVCNVCISVSLIIAVVIAAPLLIEKAARGEMSLEGWPGLRSVLGSTPKVCLILGGVLGLKLGAASYLWRWAVARRVVTARQFLGYCALWVAATAVLAGCCHLLLAAPGIMMIAPRLRYFGPLAALSFFPLARIPLAAIALNHNRHR